MGPNTRLSRWAALLRLAGMVAALAALFWFVEGLDAPSNRKWMFAAFAAVPFVYFALKWANVVVFGRLGGFHDPDESDEQRQYGLRKPPR